MPVITETYNGFPAGMNLNRPPQELDPEEVRYLQDAMLDEPGLIRRRGPVQKITGYYEHDVPIHGLVTTLDPNANLRAGVFSGRQGDTVGKFDIIADDGQSIAASLDWNEGFASFPPNYPYHIVDTKAMLGGAIGGGVMIGTAEHYNSSAKQKLGYWYGANKANYSTGTVTFTRGNYTVTGAGTSWSANVVPGMFLFANIDDPSGVTGQTLLGIVRSVDSNTQVTLVQKLPFSGTTKNYVMKSIRGIMPKIAKGNITTTTASTTVTGGRTKFRDWGLASGVWCIYRAADMTYVGKVSSVTTNISLTLSANAAIDMSNERFVALRADGDWDLATWTASATYPVKPGFITATYGERQWYANNSESSEGTYRLWFSDPEDFEALDMADFDGDFIQVASSTQVNLPIQALVPAYNSLVILKENEVAAVFGSSPTTFNVRKISDDGTLCGMSAQPWAGGVIWAGKDNINFFDGLQVISLTEEKLGGFYKNLMRTFDPTQYRLTSMINRDHYFLFIENCSPDFAPVKGANVVTQNRVGIVINLVTRAIGTTTNLNFRGSAPLPASSGWNTWYLLNVIKGPGQLADTNIMNAYPFADFEWAAYGTMSFTGDAATLARDTTTSYGSGSACLKVTANGTQTYAVANAPQIRETVNGISVIPGERYTAEVWVKSPIACTAGINIGWTLNGTWVSSSGGDFVTLVPNTWTKVRVSGIAPASTNGAWAAILFDKGVVWGNGEVAGYLDQLVFSHGADAAEFQTGMWFGAAKAQMTISSAQQRFGSYSLKVVTPGTVAYEGAQARVNVSSATQYKLSGWLKKMSATTTPLVINWYTSGDAYISTDAVNFGTATDTWLYQSQTVTSPGTAAYGMIFVGTDTVPTALTFYLDGFTFSATASGGKDYASGIICDADDLFDLTGNDSYSCDGDTAGPDLYIESRRFNMDDSMRLKYFKSMAMYYVVQGGDLNVDVSLGLNTPGVTVTDKFAATTITWALTGTSYSTWDSLATQNATWDILSGSIFQPKRIMLHKRDQFLGFRIWQATAAITEATLGPVSIAFKFMRKQRLVA